MKYEDFFGTHWFSFFLFCVSFFFLSLFFPSIVFNELILFVRFFIYCGFIFYVNLLHFFVTSPDYVDRFFLVCNDFLWDRFSFFYIEFIQYSYYYIRIFSFEVSSFFAETSSFHILFFENIFFIICCILAVGLLFSVVFHNPIGFLVHLKSRFKHLKNFSGEDRYKEIMAMKSLLKSMRENDGIDVKVVTPKPVADKKSRSIFSFFKKKKLKTYLVFLRVAERLKAADCKSVLSGTQVRILSLPCVCFFKFSPIHFFR